MLQQPEWGLHLDGSLQGTGGQHVYTWVYLIQQGVVCIHTSLSCRNDSLAFSCHNDNLASPPCCVPAPCIVAASWVPQPCIRSCTIVAVTRPASLNSDALSLLLEGAPLGLAPFTATEVQLPAPECCIYDGGLDVSTIPKSCLLGRQCTASVSSSSGLTCPDPVGVESADTLASS